MRIIRTIFLILISAAVLSACGLRGPLYLPAEDPAPKPGAEQVTNGDDDKEKDKKEENEIDRE